MNSSKAIQTRFAEKSDTYRNFAKAQLEAAHKLVDIFNTQLKHLSGIWLDIGSGPSIISHIESASPTLKNGIQFDISMESLVQNGTSPAKAIVGDMDALPIASHSLDGIISSSAFQWSQNLPHLLEELFRILKEGGHVIISILGEKTLAELRELQTTFGIKTFTSYYTKQELDSYTINSGFKTLHSETQVITLRYSSSKEALQSISKIGASSHQNSLLTPKELVQFITAYDRIFNNTDVTHTYEYHFLLLRKPLT